MKYSITIKHNKEIIFNEKYYNTNRFNKDLENIFKDKLFKDIYLKISKYYFFMKLTLNQYEIVYITIKTNCLNFLFENENFKLLNFNLKNYNDKIYNYNVYEMINKYYFYDLMKIL